MAHDIAHVDEIAIMRNLEIGDDVDDNIIRAYNTLIKGPRHVVHSGRPREGDKVRKAIPQAFFPNVVEQYKFFKLTNIVKI